MNVLQTYLDAVQRTMSRLGRDMFSLWWQNVTVDLPPDGKQGSDKKFARLAAELQEQYKVLVAKEQCEK